MCIAAAIGGAAVLGLAGSAIQGHAAQSAAGQQASAQEQAAQIQAQEFKTITGQEQPFMQAGYGALGALDYGLGIGGQGVAAHGGGPAGRGAHGGGEGAGGPGYGSLLQPFTEANWQQLSPAYNFQRQQGMQGTLNMDATGQGALSGAAQKDLMGFNQNLANTSFQNAFNMYQTQQGNIYQRLAGVAQLGQAAAANTGQQGTALAGQQGQAVGNVGTALAGGTVGAANAYAGALGNAGSLGMLYAMNQGGGGPYGYSGGGYVPPDSSYAGGG